MVSSASRLRLRQWSLLASLLVLIPLTATYRTYSRKWVCSSSILVDQQKETSSSPMVVKNLFCRKRYIDVQKEARVIPGLPQSIARLATYLSEVSARPRWEEGGPIPWATYFWLIVNVGLYAWYWHHRIDPRTVALDATLLLGSDFGRALSGNLAHFEIWHLGINAMSLVNLGEAMEQSVLSNIELFLWTASFLAFTTVVVVGIYVVQKVVLDRRQGIPFPSMVGFSGILFCWSVFATLSLPEDQQMCPIPVLTSVCFSTHRLGDHLRFSWAPLIQLGMTQILLPRASFAGHLSGLLVGFLWYSGLLPPLEWSQPCISFPILWATGKYALHHHHGSFSFQRLLGEGTDSDQESGGHLIGGGGIIDTNRWSQSPSSSCDDARHSRVLNWSRNIFAIHWIGVVYVSVWQHKTIDSIVVSEGLLLMLFAAFVRAVRRHTGTEHGPLFSFGILGRAYVAFCLISIVTDSMAVGGWLAVLTETGSVVVWLGFFLVRLALCVLSISVVCYCLDRAHELPEPGSDGCGIWTNVLGGSFLVDPCLALGTALVESKWTESLSSASSHNDNHGSSLSSASYQNDRIPDAGELRARRVKMFSSSSSKTAATTSSTTTCTKTNPSDSSSATEEALGIV